MLVIKEEVYFGVMFKVVLFGLVILVYYLFNEYYKNFDEFLEVYVGVIEEVIKEFLVEFVEI